MRMKWALDVLDTEKEGVSTHMSGFRGLDVVSKVLLVATGMMLVGTVVAIVVAYTIY